MIEILAPAGGPEALTAAVNSGCDAVYLGGPSYGARANARNFTREELTEAVKFCRARDVRVHVTVNTLLKDSEINDALELVEFLCSIPVDAVLVQDMGLFSLLRKCAPGLPLHASTQMSLHTAGGVKFIEDLGASRAVLARELSLKEIKDISENTAIELEAFAHGALCMSVSGQCYFSAVLGGRSGNRGSCAQPCRLPFSAEDGTGHDLSLKDLSFLPRLSELESAGVCSAKIEGRMKRPEYVAAAVSAARRSADGEDIPKKLLDDLEAVFSRSGFTDGYLTEKRGRGMFGIRTKEDVTGATEKVLSSLRGLYKDQRQSVKISLSLYEEKGEIILKCTDNKGNISEARQPAADVQPLSPQRCEEQLKKTGGTPFFAENVTVPEDGVRLQISGLNAMRRSVLENLLTVREKAEKIPFKKINYIPSARIMTAHDGAVPMRGYFRSIDQIPENIGLFSEAVLPLYTENGHIEKLKSSFDGDVILELPRAFFGSEKEVISRVKELMARGYDKFSTGNLGGVRILKDLGAQIHGAFGLNIFNTASLDFFESAGLVSAELSFELSGRETAALGGKLRRGASVYGRQAVMMTRNCPIANSKKGCLNCTSPHCLTDRKGIKFPVMCTGHGAGRYAEIFNSVPLWLGGESISLKNTDFVIFRFTVENSVETGETVKAFLNGDNLRGGYTRGLFTHGVD